eukprot:2940237-Prymnesium_polylepis.2
MSAGSTIRIRVSPPRYRPLALSPRSRKLPMLSVLPGTSNIRTPGTCHACSRKVPSERANLTPPPT